MDLAFVLEETQSNGVNRCIAPSLVKEAARPIEMVEVILVSPAPPKFHISNLKVGPEMAG